MVKGKHNLSEEQSQNLHIVLEERFEENMHRHEGLAWAEIASKLKTNTEKLWSLNEMEKSGGEPDVVGYDQNTQEFVFCDCAPESPIGRRNLCYDNAALESRKKNKPGGSAVDTALSMGVDILTEEQYRELQELGEFDLKTSSWVATPGDIRELGGALFCSRRYNHVFLFHNGADSYYGARGFRGLLKV